MSWTLCSVVLLGLAHISYSQTTVTLTTTKGVIIGLRWNPNPNSKASYDAFLGIPYGQIPGRFQPPVPRANWTSPLFTQRDGPACPQPSTTFPSAIFSEDCLYLNVFTPVDASSAPGKLPVVAYIHGSDFTSGTSTSNIYGPDFIVPQGVVLVTMNYRLGAAGFLTLGSSLAPGNLGLLDTQLALRWVQQEISVFGGDPGQVTLAGQSAGSVMTMFHYLSNTSSGMFQRAIAHSGSALSTWGHVTAAEAVRRAKLLADAVGCNTTLSDSQILKCLQSADINSIVNHQKILLPFESIASGNQLPFVPVIDTSFGNPAFFTNSFESLLKDASIRAKPLIAGFTTEEGMFLFDDYAWKLAQYNPEGFIPWRLEGALSYQQKTALGGKIKNKYFPETVDQNKVLDSINLYTDYAFAYPVIDVIKHLPNSTYGYVFAYNGAWAPTPPYMSQYHVTGVFHGADMYYLFYGGQDLSTCTSNQPNLDVKDNMVRWWTGFVKNGTAGLPGLWTPASSGQYLYVDSALITYNASDVEDRHYSFWANLTASDLSNTAFTAKTNLLLIFTTIFVIKLKCNF